MSPDRILIVDDNRVNRKLLRTILELCDYELSEAEDAEQALVVLRESPPSLVLMDLQLPGMDGLELTRRVKADPELRTIIVVAVTSYAMKGDRDRALAAGCDDYVAKPIDTEALPPLISSLLSARAAGSRGSP